MDPPLVGGGSGRRQHGAEPESCRRGVVQNGSGSPAPTLRLRSTGSRCPGCAVAGKFLHRHPQGLEGRGLICHGAYRLDVVSLAPSVCPTAGPRRHRSRLRCASPSCISHNHAISPPTATARSTMCPMAAAPAWCSSPNRCSRPWGDPRQGALSGTADVTQGRPLQQADLQRWATEHDQLVLLCGHYEGFDERIRGLADEGVSIGDFVLTGGAGDDADQRCGAAAQHRWDGESLVDETTALCCSSTPLRRRTSAVKRCRMCCAAAHAAIETWRQQQQEQRTRERRPASMPAGQWPAGTPPRCRSESATATTSTGWWRAASFSGSGDIRWTGPGWPQRCRCARMR